MPFGVLKHFHPMIGRDLHIVMPPGSTILLPAAPHLSAMILMGTGLTAKFGPTEYSHFGWTMMRGTDIGPVIPHIGPPNCLLPVVLLTSASKSNFGSSKHLIENKPVATAVLMIANLNLNCGDAFALPTGTVLALTAHFVGMTVGDFLAGLFEMALDMGLQWAIGNLCTQFDGISQRVYEKYLFGPLGWALDRMGSGRISTWLLQHDFQEMIFKGLGANLAGIALSDLVGSPLGYSAPVNLFGAVDSLFGKDGATQGSYDAVHDYFGNPSVDTHDVPPDGAEGSSGVAEGDGGSGGDGGVSSDVGTDAGSDAPTSTSTEPNETPVDQEPNMSTDETPNETSAGAGGDSPTGTEPNQTPTGGDTDSPADTKPNQTPADAQPNQTPADPGANSSIEEPQPNETRVDRDPNDPSNSSSGP